MKNPNAMATLTAGSLVLSLEQLGQDYVNVHLGPFWSKAVLVAVSTIVLYVGRDGLKGCLNRVVDVARAVWTGPAAKRPTTPTK